MSDLVAVRYRLGPPQPLGAVYIEERVQRDGSARWAVTRDGSVLTKAGEWEYEPQPSSRDDDFIERSRWNNTMDAAKAAREALARG